jgi:hypothetical protein
MSASAGEVVIATVSAAFGHKNREEITMPRYHFVVRAPDHTHDDPDGTHFPNHDTAREHGHRIVRELADGGYNLGMPFCSCRMRRSPLDHVLSSHTIVLD